MYQKKKKKINLPSRSLHNKHMIQIGENTALGRTTLRSRQSVGYADCITLMWFQTAYADGQR